MLMPSPQQAQRLPLASQRMPSGTPFPSCTTQKVRPLTIAVPPFTTSNTFTLCGSSGWSVRSSSFRLWKKDGRRKTERERWYSHSPSVPLAPESAMYLPPPRPSALGPRDGEPLASSVSSHQVLVLVEAQPVRPDEGIFDGGQFARARIDAVDAVRLLLRRLAVAQRLHRPVVGCAAAFRPLEKSRREKLLCTYGR